MPLLRVLLLLFAIAGTAAAAERAGIVQTVVLNGEDAARGTAIARRGKDLQPFAAMTLYAGDIVYLTSRDSVLSIVFPDNTLREIRGPARIALEGGTQKGGYWDEIWSVFEKIAGNEPEETPATLASKGEGIEVRVAPAGGTILRGADPVVLIWSGGTAPYWISIDDARYKTDTARLDFAIPAGAGKRLRVEIKDERGALARLTLRLADQGPAMPTEIESMPGSQEFRRTAAAAWLARQPKWRLEALRQLNQIKDYEPARKLFAALAEGR